MVCSKVHIHEQLRRSVASYETARRPLLTRLTADSAWLLSLPVPASYSVQNQSKRYFHILIDSWLAGSHVDVAKFVSTSWHEEESAVQNIAEVNTLIGVIEDASADDGARRASTSTKAELDTIMISFEFTDHMYKETLLQVHPAVPVIASKKASTIIASWKHFETVVEMPTFLGGDWRGLMSDALPAWIRIAKLSDPLDPYPGLHCAFTIIFADQLDDQKQGEPEAIVYTPHGISVDGAKVLATSQPQIKTLALMHGLDVVKLPMTVNLGAHNGLKVGRTLKTKYWVATHDEAVPIKGIIGYLVRRQPLTAQDALRKEAEDNFNFEDESFAEDQFVDNSGFKDLRNGETLVLL